MGAHAPDAFVTIVLRLWRQYCTDGLNGWRGNTPMYLVTSGGIDRRRISTLASSLLYFATRILAAVNLQPSCTFCPLCLMTREADRRCARSQTDC